MEPTSTPTVHADAGPVTDLVRSNRAAVAAVLLVLAALALGLTAYLAYKGFAGGTPPPAADAPPTELDAKPADPNRPDYVVGMIGALGWALTLGSTGAWLLVNIPPADAARQRADVRTAILTLGLSLGGILLAVGLVYFLRWSDSLTGWLDRGDAKERKWVLYPLLMLVGGAGLVLLAVQPARAEERNNPRVRRVVYGANLGVLVFLLFVALVAANVVFALRVPNRLDTTATGFYSLSEPTREFLARLDQPVTAYAILTESGAGDRVADDTRRMLDAFADASNGKFRVRSLSRTLNRTEIADLRGRYPQVQLNALGVLLTVGADEKRYVFIRDDEFATDSGGGMGRRGSIQFNGESRLLQDLLFLADNEQRAVVYFTQGAGELDVSDKPPAPGETTPGIASASQLKGFLEKRYLTVKPLTFDAGAAEVPADAAVVIVAEPRGPLAEPAVQALTKYMNEPRGGKKGKLIVLSSARPGPGGKVVKTGLEPLLEGFNVRLSDKFLLSRPTDDDPEILVTTAVVTPNAEAANNPVAVVLRSIGLTVPFWREVSPLPGNPQYTPLPLLMSTPGRQTWLEEDEPRDQLRLLQSVFTSAEVRRAKQFGGARPLAVLSSEGATGRLAVIGNGVVVSDEVARQTRGASVVPFELVGGTIDWLRDRPVVGQGVAAKTYSEYTFPPGVDATRVLWLPLGLAMLTVVGLGAGVWVTRRR